jgi:hypothetical protein
MAEPGEFCRDGSQNRNAVLRRGPIGKPIVHDEDLARHLIRVEVRADDFDDAREFVPWASWSGACSCVRRDSLASGLFGGAVKTSFKPGFRVLLRIGEDQFFVDRGGDMLYLKTIPVCDRENYLLGEVAEWSKAELC